MNDTLLEDIQAQQHSSLESNQTTQIVGLRRYIAKLEQQLEVLQNCRSADHITCQSFQKLIVQQQRIITDLEQENKELLQHLNPSGVT